MNLLQRNREVMVRFQTMINTADHNLAAELIDAQASFYALTSKEPLYGGEGYLSVVEMLRKSFSDVRWEIVDMAVEADKVAVHWTCSGTHDGPFMGLAPTGKKFSFGCMNFYYVNEQGKITSDVAGQGLLGLLQCLGLVPAPGA